jgi:cell division septation protein DedD
VLLIPTDAKPPVSDGSANAPPKPAPANASSAAKSNAEPASAPPSNPAQRVPRIQSLERGKYYVQIATFKYAESVNTVAAQYGDKYPLVQIVNDASSASQILVGPLGADEYGAVLERFKAYGYADAFLRVGK